MSKKKGERVLGGIGRGGEWGIIICPFTSMKSVGGAVLREALRRKEEVIVRK